MFSRLVSASMLSSASSAPEHTAATPSVLTLVVTQLTDPSNRDQTGIITGTQNFTHNSDDTQTIDLFLTIVSYFACILVTFLSIFQLLFLFANNWSFNIHVASFIAPFTIYPLSVILMISKCNKRVRIWWIRHCLFM